MSCIYKHQNLGLNETFLNWEGIEWVLNGILIEYTVYTVNNHHAWKWVGCVWKWGMDPPNGGDFKELGIDDQAVDGGTGTRRDPLTPQMEP